MVLSKSMPILFTFYSTTKYEILVEFLILLRFIFFNLNTSFNAIVSPGEIGSFNSSNANTQPLVRYGNNSFKQVCKYQDQRKQEIKLFEDFFLNIF